MKMMSSLRAPQELAPHPVDVIVGKNLRACRKSCGMTQSGLADILGLTFQQVQKYELGKNRISASKLYEAAHALGIDIRAFYAGLIKPSHDPGNPTAEVSPLASTPEGRELAKSYAEITTPHGRKLVRDLAAAIALAQLR